MIYHLSITKHRDDPYQIAIYKTRHDLMMGHKADYHAVEAVADVVIFLMGVYGWHPNIDCPGCGLNLNVVPP